MLWFVSVNMVIGIIQPNGIPVPDAELLRAGVARGDLPCRAAQATLGRRSCSTEDTVLSSRCRLAALANARLQDSFIAVVDIYCKFGADITRLTVFCVAVVARYHRAKPVKRPVKPKIRVLGPC